MRKAVTTTHKIIIRLQYIQMYLNYYSWHLNYRVLMVGSDIIIIIYSFLCITDVLWFKNDFISIVQEESCVDVCFILRGRFALNIKSIYFHSFRFWNCLKFYKDSTCISLLFVPQIELDIWFLLLDVVSFKWSPLYLKSSDTTMPTLATEANFLP